MILTSVIAFAELVVAYWN